MRNYFFIMVLFAIFSILSFNEADAQVGPPSFSFDNSQYPFGDYFFDHGMYIEISYPAGQGPGINPITVQIDSTASINDPSCRGGLTQSFIEIRPDVYALETSYVYFSTVKSYPIKPSLCVQDDKTDTITVQVTNPFDSAQDTVGLQNDDYGGAIPSAPPTGPDYSYVIDCFDALGLNGGDDDGDGLCNNWDKDFFKKVKIKDWANPALGEYIISCGNVVGCPWWVDPHRDVYIEYDWMPGHKPNLDDLNEIKSIYEDHQVYLHFYEGEEIPIHKDAIAPPDVDDCMGGSPFDSDYEKLKKNYFGSPSDRLDPNKLTLKRQVFHYIIFGHKQLSGATGTSELNGQDILITLGGLEGGVGTKNDLKGTVMHELGHNFGLDHSGLTDFPNCEPNYPSVMSHSRQLDTYLGSQTLDYSSGDMSEVDESPSLNEVAGVGPDGDGKLIVFNSVSGITTATAGEPGLPGSDPGRVDWDDDDTVEGSISSLNLNYFDGLSTCMDLSINDQLRDNDDWDNLSFDIKQTCGFADGVAISPENQQRFSKQTRIATEPSVAEFRQLEVAMINSTINKIKTKNIDENSKAQLIEDLENLANYTQNDYYYGKLLKSKDIVAKIEGSGIYERDGPLISDSAIRQQILNPANSILKVNLEKSKPYNHGVSSIPAPTDFIWYLAGAAVAAGAATGAAYLLSRRQQENIVE